MRTLLAAAALVAAAIAPATVQGQSLQEWTCTANDGNVDVHRIGPGQFQTVIEMHNIWSTNWCGQGECTYANGRFNFEGDMWSFTLDMNTGAFIDINFDGRFTGTCRVTG